MYVLEIYNEPQQSRQHGIGEEKIHKSLAWDSKSRKGPMHVQSVGS